MVETGYDEEVAVLGAIMIDGGVLGEVSAFLYERDFYSEQHRLIYRAMVELMHGGQPVDAVTVIAKLKERKCLTRVGGATGVSDLMDYCPDVANAVYYAREVKKKSLSRDLHRVGGLLRDGSEKPIETLDRGLSALNELSNQSISSQEVLVGDMTSDVLSTVLEGNGKQEGLVTGFQSIDYFLWGMNPGDLIILAARPSEGKSAFTLQVAANVAKNNKHVLFVSPEMTARQIAMRLLSLESNVQYKKLDRGKGLTDEERDVVKTAHERIQTLPLVIDDSPRQTLSDVRIKARRMQASGKLDLVVVDYLQLLCAGDDSKEAVTEISKGLKALAKDLQIPVWAVSQLSRAATYRDSRRPQLTDLRGSGQLEQDADVVIFIWFIDKKAGKVEIFLDKHRNGPCGGQSYEFDHSTTRFTVGSW